MRQPRALLLDEPTNHLDDKGVAYLEQHLVRLPGVVVLASHDRAFLDAVGTDLLDLDPARGGATRFGGRFSDYVVHRRNERTRWERAWTDQQRELAALGDTAEHATTRVAHNRGPRDNDKFIVRFKGERVATAVARRSHDALRRIELIERNPVPPPPEPLQFAARFGDDPVDPNEPLVVTRAVAVCERLAPTTLTIAPGARLLVTGANGAGKSTLLELLAGDLDPTNGHLVHRDGARIGRLPQDPTFGPGLHTPRAADDEVVREVDRQVPTLEELGLLTVRDIDRPLAHLSEGQRRRVALALLVAWSPELLLLDEPSNHLSPALVSELEDALLDAPSAVVVATHDRWLRERWPGARLHLDPALERQAT